MKRWVLFFILAFGIARTAFADAAKDELYSNFVDGQTAYKQALYADAAAAYEKIIESGHASGPVYYNLGNAYYRAGQRGKAVLNYERARRLIPRDHDLQFNERYAVSAINQPAVKSIFVMRALKHWADFWTVDEILWICVCLFALLAGAHMASLFGHWPRGLARGVLTGIAVALLIFSVGVFIKTSEGRAAVILENTRARFEPRENATVYFQAWAGEKVDVVETDEGWSKIRRSDGKLGWVAAGDVEKIE